MSVGCRFELNIGYEVVRRCPYQPVARCWSTAGGVARHTILFIFIYCRTPFFRVGQLLELWPGTLYYSYLSTAEPLFFAGVYFSQSASLKDSVESNVCSWHVFSTIIILFGDFSRI